MKDYSDTFKELTARLSQAEGYLRIVPARDRVVQLEADASRPDLWDDPDQARRVTSELRELQGDIETFENLSDELENTEVLHELALDEDDDSHEEEISEAIADMSRRFDDVELRSLLSGEHDDKDAVCDINSGAGGTDAQDWAEMLLRMYLRWADKKGFDIEIQEVTEGQEAGISSATFIVRGRYAFGYLQAERGVHRLVRISPFDANARRQTAFSALKVVPFFDEVSDEVDIDEKDLRIDTYRSSGAGGQHVNVTDSAVRITHLPTGVVVACQNERSQHQNKDRAMQMLAAKLAARQRDEREAEMNALAGEQRDVAWGSQIRSYVLAPYQQVKDLRSGHEVGNPDSVLDGDVDAFMEAWLRWNQEHGAAQT
ncbi:MAG: peptide chain release factor 2 [Actinomycetia bacterium]|nr:peptide chain release factor 2 [Actinomycetes bacterium]MCP4957842.1 peptide chain release factor 2 [Actinomycetes bacterium]